MKLIILIRLVLFIFLINYSRCSNQYLKSLIASHIKAINTETLLVEVSKPIENTCISFYKNLAQVSSQFIECVANNSRPYHVCQNCLLYYLEFNEAYKLIQDNTDIYANTLYKDGLTCQNIVEATDRVQTVVKISNTIKDIWKSSNCDDCFESKSLVNGTFNFTLKPAILEFYLIQQNLEICISNFTQKPSSLDPLFQNYTSNCSLCRSCKNDYINLTKQFLKIGNDNDNENNMCMDVVDLYNYTRIAWSKGYQCNYREIDEIKVLIVSGSFIIATVSFYIAVRIINKEEKKEYAKINRKKSLLPSNLGSLN